MRMVYSLLAIIGLTTGTYYFDQFNVKFDLPTYTSEEYEEFLRGTTSGLKSLMMKTTIGQRRKRTIYGRSVLISTCGGF